MSECKKIQAQLPEYAYNELDEKTKSEFEAHLSSCKSCTDTLREFTETLDVMNKKENHEPGDAFWNNYWDNLNARMKEDGVHLGKNNRVKRLNFPEDYRKWAYRMISAAALLITGIGIGFLLFTQPDRTIVSNQVSEIPAKQAALNQETANYLESSKILLLGFVNFDTDQVDPSAMDFSRQQEMARSLIRKTAVLKDELKGKENQRVLELMKELEIILLQISNYEKDFNIPAIDLIKSGVDNSSIMMKINIEELIRSAENETRNTKNNKKKMDL